MVCDNTKFLKRYHSDPEFAEKIRSMSRDNARRKVKEYRDALYDILGGAVCTCDGEDCWHEGKCRVLDKRVLHFDHINGCGQVDKKEKGGGLQFLRYYYNNQHEARSTLQVRCANCNWIKKLNHENFGRPRKYTHSVFLK